MKIEKFGFIILFNLAFIGSKGQTMYVRFNSGLQSPHPVANIQKLTFSNGNLLVTNTIGTNDAYLLSDNRYINFTDLTLDSVYPEIVNNSFYLYPNPTATILYVANDDSSQVLSSLEIVSLEGRVLIKQNKSQVELGMYLCKITSNNKTQTIKFLKQ